MQSTPAPYTTASHNLTQVIRFIRAGLAIVLAVCMIGIAQPASAAPLHRNVPNSPLVLAPLAGVVSSPLVCYATLDGVTIFSSVNAIALQQAIDAATPGNLVKVAGTCAGVQTLAGDNQTAYISKTLTLQGGYTNTVSGWLISDPASNPTVLDAQSTGRVIFAAAPLTLSNLTLQNGSAGANKDGGGLFIAPSAGSVTISATQLLTNTAGRSGGGIAISGTIASRVSVIVVDATLRANSAITNGGGIVASGNTTVTLSNAQFITNTAGQVGGGAFLDGRVEDTSSTFTRNYAGAIGGNFGAGGLYARSAALTSTQFLTNTTARFGGGLGMLDDLVMNGGLFQGNQAFRAGGLFAHRSGWSLTGTQFIANSAIGNGGGAMYLNNAGGTQFANLINLWVERNTSDNFAGGIFINSPNTTLITGSTFLSNTSPNVGAIGTGGGAANGTLLIYGSRFEGNQSTAQSAGVLQASRPALTVISKTAFLRNTAATDAGAVQITSGSVQLVNNLFADNTAGSNIGAATYLSSTGSFTLWHNTFAGDVLNAGSAINMVTGNAQLRNNIVASYTTGINVAAGASTEDYNLFDTVATPRAGLAAGANSVIGVASFVAPASDDYTFTPASNAINMGASLGVPDDFFGNVRPQKVVPDAGYFESPYVLLEACNTEINGDNLSDFSSSDAQAVRDAVAAVAVGGTVKVAGTCAGAIAQNGTTQVTLITQTLTLIGGFTATNWLAGSDAAANPTVLDANGGGRVISATVPVTISNLTVQNGNTSDNGGGAWFGNRVVLSGTTFLSNTAAREGGGAVAFDTATVNGGSFISNTSGNRGGGLALDATTSQLFNTNFISNVAKGDNSNSYGGGLWSSGAIEQTGGVYQANVTAWNGGGIQAAGGYSLTNVSFFSNTADGSGGGVHQFNSLGAVPSRVTGGIFQGNSANNGSGGAIYAYANPLLVSGTQVLSNSANQTGGGVFNYNATRIVNSVIQNNNARAVFSRYTLEIAGSQFISNSGGSGSAAFSDGGGVAISDSWFERNDGLGGSGGAIFAGSNQGIASANIRNSVFLSNTGGSGAAVFVNNGPINVQDSRFEDHIAGNSGGVLFTMNTVEVSNSTFISNTAGTYSGGAIFGYAGIDVTNSRFEKHAGGSGGTLFASGAININHSSFLTSTSGNNPGGTLFGSSTVDVTNSHFENSNSKGGTGPGGAIFSNNRVALTNTDFISNSADAIGGAVFGQVKVTGGRFERNSAAGGGAIWGTFGAMSVISGATFMSNTASGATSSGGGAVWVNASADIRNSTFTGNTSGGHAGALWVQQAGTLDNVTFISNAVTSTYGGGALWANNAITITNSSFMSNTSAGWAGGAFLQGAFTLSRTQFVANSSPWSGGGVMRGGFGGNGQIVNSLFARNSAGRGAAIDIDTIGTITIAFSTIASEPPAIGAAIHITQNATVNITNTIIASHTVGIQQDGAATVGGDYNLFFGNGADSAGSVVTGSNSLNGNPAFVDPLNDNYRLTLASKALNAATDLGITIDYDGNPRPFDGGFDIGAFELQTSNQPPVADAGAPFTVTVNALATLDGSASSDPENLALTFVWSQVSGTSVMLDNSAAVSPTFTAPGVAGELVFQLVVTDAYGLASAPAFVTVTVTNGEPIADAGAPFTITVNAPATLDGSGSSDPDGHSLTFGWLQVSGTSVTLSDNSAVTPTFTAPAITGTLVFQLVVTDAFGLVSAPALVTVTVEALPVTEIPPSGAIITTTTGNALLQPSTEFTQTLGEGSEPITFVWDFGDGSPIYTGTTASHVYPPGTYTATLTATNSAGTVTTTIIVFVPWRMLLSIMVKDSTLPVWQRQQ